MDIGKKDIKFLKGVGEARAKVLASELDIHRVVDLLNYFPTRYVDKSRVFRISELRENMSMMQVRGQFVRFATEGEGRRKRLIGLFTDGQRHMEVTWFSNVSYFINAYQIGKEYLLFGKPVLYRHTWQMSHPEVETFDPDRKPEGLVGIYPLTETLRKKGLSSRFFRNIIRNNFSDAEYDSIEETLPAGILEAYRLLPIGQTLRNLHNPQNQELLQKARERMKFEELFYLELNILRFARERNVRTTGYRLPKVGEYFNSFYKNHIPFRLTDAQRRVIKEVRADMLEGRQMNRLLQGDVGSGKTMVAFMVMLLAVDNGLQACMMAPTEILAAQHYASLKGWCDALGLQIRLLTGSSSTKMRREIDEMLESGELNILVGTHALLEDKVTFNKLGVAVIDEQHRFGVAQRAKLWKKGKIAPHILVMTATPIPRTLAMTVYGDLEVSVIDELPPGRKPVSTHLYFEENRMGVYRHIMKQIQEGRQAYIVYPLIHENEKLELKSLEKGVERLRDIFKGVELSYVHGQMKPAEKDLQMQRFAEGVTKILVATTVIEVGVNVPNASVMLIENAERFGLSQLHQLRGRVGRGADLSYCILMSKQNIGADTRKRLKIMTETTDGFLVSEADMKLRGPGDLEGTQQSGLAFNLKIASLAQDGQILTMAREAAGKLLDRYPQLYNLDLTKNSWTVENGEEGRVVALLTLELHKRFSKSFDWSRIS